MAGLGGLLNGNITQFLAGQFHDHGYHVVIVPNSFQSRFAYAASTTGYVGASSEDAKDMHSGMLKILENLRVDKKVTIDKTYLIGYSMGALCAAYISELDARQKTLGVEKTILINTPVDLAHGMRTLDGFKAESKGIGLFRKIRFALRLQNAKEKAESRPLSAATVAEYRKTVKSLKTKELAFVVGTALARPLKKLVMSTQDIHNLGVLPGIKGHDYPKRYDAAKRFTFIDYGEKILTPFYSKLTGDKTLTFAKISDQASLPALEDYLAGSSTIYLMHNRDDFLLRDGDIEYLEELFGERSRVFSTGGHLGNIWRPENVQQILSWLKGK